MKREKMLTVDLEFSSIQERLFFTLLERSSPDNEFVDRDPKGPDIAQPFVVKVAARSFGRQVFDGTPAQRREESVRRARVPLLRETKVDHDGSVVGSE